MKRTTFKNKTFYCIIILILFGLLIQNLYSIISQFRIIGLLPIMIQSALLTLIFIKHEYVKIGIKIWAIIFLAVASGLQFIGRLLQYLGKYLQGLSEGLSTLDIQHYLTTGVTMVIGILVVFYTNKTVEIEKNESSGA